VHSADYHVTQKEALDQLKGSLKLNGSVWVKSVKRDTFQFIRIGRYNELRIKNVTCNC
jgi:hypothetical protein